MGPQGVPSRGAEVVASSKQAARASPPLRFPQGWKSRSRHGPDPRPVSFATNLVPDHARTAPLRLGSADESLGPLPPARQALRRAFCHLECRYCFYLPKRELLPDAPARMSDETLEHFTRAYIEAQPAGTSEVEFAWQGGEPTLAGLAFFERALEAAAALRASGHGDPQRAADQRHAARRGLGAFPRAPPVPRRRQPRRAAGSPTIRCASTRTAMRRTRVSCARSSCSRSTRSSTTS